MVAGDGTAVVQVPIARLRRVVPVTTAICFEVAYDDLIREGVLAGGELIVIPTNNASFGLTQESTQQLAMSRFRAAEHERAVVQISTVGVSALIRPDGVVLEQTGLFTAEQMIGELPLRTSITLADRLGEWPALVVGVLAVSLLALGVVSRPRRPRPVSRAGRGVARESPLGWRWATAESSASGRGDTPRSQYRALGQLSPRWASPWYTGWRSTIRQRISHRSASNCHTSPNRGAAPRVCRTGSARSEGP